MARTDVPIIVKRSVNSWEEPNITLFRYFQKRWPFRAWFKIVVATAAYIQALRQKMKVFWNRHVSTSQGSIRCMSDTRQPAEISGPSDDPKLTFMGVPAEIRMVTYNHLVVSKRLILVTGTSNSGQEPIHGRLVICSLGPKVSSILQVSRKIHSEAVGVLYGKNILVTHRRGDKCF